MKRLIGTTLAALLLLAACNKDEETGSKRQRRPNPVSVLEYTPAPGQFINETTTGEMPADLTTGAEAAAWAQQRLDAGQYVSLGGFGGYIVVRFRKSIEAHADGYDFSITDNAFDTSNEPGIVWVMQDANGNGRPDDTWYELKGSETGKPTTIRDYEVTYYKPAAPQQPVRWIDNRGNEGQIEYLAAYHKQDYYYPSWIAAPSYTLKGTRIEARNFYNEAKQQWENRPYGWGYADNAGSDRTDNATGFRIANAIDASGQSVALASIDFVKVQTAVNFQSQGSIGEVSTEVFRFTDLTLE